MEMKNRFDRLIGKLDNSKKRIIEHGHRPKGITETETQREKLKDTYIYSMI